MSVPVPFWFEPGATLECDPVLAGDRLLVAALDATVHAVELATGRLDPANPDHRELSVRIRTEIFMAGARPAATERARA